MMFKLKPDFLLGAASAATQIEGGELNHNWNDWYNRGKIKDGTNPARTNEHYDRWQEDADVMSSMGLRIYRFGIEWARLCPTEDTVDEAVVAHYREEILYLKEKGISLLLTIHHFTNSMWFEKKGGFTKSENNKYYLELVDLVVKSFGDLISEYITINEPNVYATESFFYGDWPPGEKSMWKAMKVMTNMVTCHIQAYEMIHKMREKMGYNDTKVSFANHLRVFDPTNPQNLYHKICSKLTQYFFQSAITKAMCLGQFEWPLKNNAKLKTGEYCDFIAINYYTRSTVSNFGDGVKKGSYRNDLGWEIYPEGIVRCANEVYSILKRPIYITENGTCDNNDTFRCRYIYDHLKALCESNLPIERYYHWCFCDNFEWLEGESARFGLVHVDYETQNRTIKESGHFYSEVIKSDGVTAGIYEKYVQNQEYHY